MHSEHRTLTSRLWKKKTGKQKFKDQATEWHKVPCMMKFINMRATFTMMYMWAYIGCRRTGEEFEVTDSIEMI